MTITFVKKILADGSPCRKCGDVINKLEASGHMAQIDQTLIADERDPESPGMQLARKLGVDRAPFFVVEQPGQEPLVYTVYMKFVKEILNDSNQREEDEAREIMENNDLDFL